MAPNVLLRAAALALLAAPLAHAAPELPQIPPAEFARLHALILPQPGESPWREIAWVTDITEARRRAVLEDKPIVVFTAADGSPIGRT